MQSELVADSGSALPNTWHHLRHAGSGSESRPDESIGHRTGVRKHANEAPQIASTLASCRRSRRYDPPNNLLEAEHTLLSISNQREARKSMNSEQQEPMLQRAGPAHMAGWHQAHGAWTQRRFCVGWEEFHRKATKSQDRLHLTTLGHENKPDDEGMVLPASDTQRHQQGWKEGPWVCHAPGTRLLLEHSSADSRSRRCTTPHLQT